MHITLSVARSADHYIDDLTSQRLVISPPEDWDGVYALRRASDAILVGGETLRRDNPSLGIKSCGLEPMRVIVSGRGELSPEAKIFHKGSGRIVVFSNIQRPELDSLCDVVVAQHIDVPLIVTELEKMGVMRLLVEGGAKILQLFLHSQMVDELRLATNPAIVVGDTAAPKFEWQEGGEIIRQEVLGGVEVVTYQLRHGIQVKGDEEMMQRTIDVSRQSPPRQSCYRVGSVVVTRDGEIFEGYTLETASTHHAEQAAIYKALAAGAELQGATIYASMEPCSMRSSEPKSCSELILEHGISRVVFALYEPSHFVECHGAENLRRAGVEVCYLPQFRGDVMALNGHVLSE